MVAPGFRGELLGNAEQKSADNLMQIFNQHWKDRYALYREYEVQDNETLKVVLSAPVFIHGMQRTDSGLELKIRAGGYLKDKAMNAEKFDFNEEIAYGDIKTVIGWTSERTNKRYVRSFLPAVTN